MHSLICWSVAYGIAPADRVEFELKRHAHRGTVVIHVAAHFLNLYLESIVFWTMRTMTITSHNSVANCVYNSIHLPRPDS